MILVVSGLDEDDSGLMSAELEEFVAIHDELDRIMSEEDSGATVAEELANDELDVSSTETLLPSSPQATTPTVTANAPNKPKCFISSVSPC